jgi:hypothetical protein
VSTRPQKRRVLELTYFSSWQLDAVNSVRPCLSSLAVHNWTVTFTLNKDNLPLEKGDFCTGTRQASVRDAVNALSTIASLSQQMPSINIRSLRSVDWNLLVHNNIFTAVNGKLLCPLINAYLHPWSGRVAVTVLITLLSADDLPCLRNWRLGLAHNMLIEIN